MICKKAESDFWSIKFIQNDFMCRAFSYPIICFSLYLIIVISHPYSSPLQEFRGKWGKIKCKV